MGRCKRCGGLLTADELADFLDQLDEEQTDNVLEHLAVALGSEEEECDGLSRRPKRREWRD